MNCYPSCKVPRHLHASTFFILFLKREVSSISMSSGHPPPSCNSSAFSIAFEQNHLVPGGCKYSILFSGTYQYPLPKFRKHNTLMLWKEPGTSRVACFLSHSPLDSFSNPHFVSHWGSTMTSYAADAYYKRAPVLHRFALDVRNHRGPVAKMNPSSTPQ